jgi:hypothetical protein
MKGIYVRKKNLNHIQKHLDEKTPSEILYAEYLLVNVLLPRHFSVSALEAVVELPAFS